MSSENDHNNSTEPGNTRKETSDLGRRNMLKALVGVPVVGALGFQVLRKASYENRNDIQSEIIKELGLEDLMSSVKSITQSSGDLIRIGIAGFGIRGPQLASALGFMLKEQFNSTVKNGSLDAQIEDGNFNVAITGICDVFDLHAEKGIATAQVRQ